MGADALGNVALQICASDDDNEIDAGTPAHQRWEYDSATKQLRVGGLDRQQAASVAPLCLTLAPNTVGYELVDPVPSYNVTGNSRYYVTNSLGMLDQEGEFYFENRTGYLYFKPPGGGPPIFDVYISANATALNLTDTHDVVIQGINVQYTTTLALSARNISRVVLRNVTIGNSGGDGMAIDGRDSVIEGNHIYGIGCSAMSIEGGNRTSLEPGNLTVTRNKIHDWALVTRSYMGGIGFGGSGNVVSFNEVYNSPHTAITGSGNNWLFEGNHVHDVCRGTTDAGAFYVGRTWSSLGNTLRNNIFNRSAPVEKLVQYSSTVGIYLDDMDSGWDVFDNYIAVRAHAIHRDSTDAWTHRDRLLAMLRLQGSPMCIELGGGRVNTVVNNRFENCGTAVHLDRRNVIAYTNPTNGTYSLMPYPKLICFGVFL